ncbi:MAG: hypothetical protein WA484_03840 [Solirubrobacteraceae bacterium]
MPAHIGERVVDDVTHDLQDGSWDRRHGHLRELDEYDAGPRLVTFSAE